MNAPRTESTAPPAARSGKPGYVSLLSRVVVVGLLSASVGLLWSGYYHGYAPKLKITHEVNATVAQLSAEVDEMDRRWSAQEMEEIHQKFRQAQSKVFSDPAAVTAWLGGLQRQAEPLGLDLKTIPGNPDAQTVTNSGVVLIPATIAVSFEPDTAGMTNASPYRRLLAFTQLVVSGEQCAELAGLTVDGGTNSITQATLELNFWAATKAAK